MEDNPKVYEWTATVGGGGTGDGSASFLPFPWDPKACFGKANLIPVKMEFDGLPYQGDIANMGAGPCIVFVKAIREKLGKRPGDTVNVRLWHDTEPRIVEAPADLTEALGGQAVAREFWEGLSPGNRRLYVKWIEEAKKPETRTNRVAKTVERLARHERF